MAILYKPTKHAFYTEGDSLTEQEHKDSCDINKMIRSIERGQNVRGGGSTTYGFDDVNMDGVQHRILKAEIESQLSNGPKEFEKEELDLIPDQVRKKFGFKQKAPKNDEPKTTKPAPQQEASKQTLPDPGTSSQTPQNEPAKRL